MSAASSNPGLSESARRGAVREMVRVLVPLARVFLGAGLAAPEFSTAVRLAFVRAAIEQAGDKELINISSVAVTTGMTRRDVRRLLAMELEAGKLQTHAYTHQRTTRVINGWKSDPLFLDEDGRPAVLPMYGTGPTFTTLSLRYAGDVPMTAVLRELLRVGAVAQNANDEIRLRKQSTRMRGYSLDAMSEIVARVRDLASTMVSNIDKTDRGTFVGFQELAQVSPDVAALFVSAFAERSAELLEGVERWSATQRRQRKRGDTPATDQRRVGMGIFLLEEPAGGDTPLPAIRPYKHKNKRQPIKRA